eukprot:3090299-Rhodomonas_salina.1
MCVLLSFHLDAIIQPSARASAVSSQLLDSRQGVRTGVKGVAVLDGVERVKIRPLSEIGVLPARASELDHLTVLMHLGFNPPPRVVVRFWRLGKAVWRRPQIQPQVGLVIEVDREDPAPNLGQTKASGIPGCKSNLKGAEAEQRRVRAGLQTHLLLFIRCHRPDRQTFHIYLLDWDWVDAARILARKTLIRNLLSRILLGCAVSNLQTQKRVLDEQRDLTPALDALTRP